ncbi:hypothetical protein D9758_006289 [Tetrapyrgos nigripes]|uniref:Catalase n=1 Tax=Tetrapyrgos nigripes TaxID=182062 RepID=A0A8H5G089_9AGAR|nr:hypothetical protein D9758_006289 [Tetrapyrgos nigripes]
MDTSLNSLLWLVKDAQHILFSVIDMRFSILLVFVDVAVLVGAVCPFMDSYDGHLEKGTTGLPGDDGFLEQFVVNDTDTFTTTDSGTAVDDTHSLKVGQRGSTLLEDFVLRTKITRFDHERIPERAAGKQTPVFLRFSTVAGSRGSADMARDVHGFALRFYTDAGNYDIVGNNIPVFFIQDAIQFPDLIHAVKPRADNEIPTAATAHDTAYDFFSQTPSSLHSLLWAMSGHGIPRSYRYIDGFGVHTFRFVNANGESKLIKWHFKTKQGRAGLLWPEAQALAGQDADFHRKDLFNAIVNEHYPEWEVGVQIVDEEDVLAYGFDMLDPTKLLPETLVPVIPVGKLVLNRNPMNYFAETEQVMFCPANLVRGIDFTEDPLLQGRLFSYLDTQLNRNMGSPNFDQIPINRARSGVHNNNRDANRTVGNGFFTTPARKVVDAHYVREISPTFLDYWTQPRLFYNSILPAEHQMIVNALRFELSHVQSATVRANFIAQINKIDNDFAVRVARAINIPAPSPDPTYYHDNTTIELSVFNVTLPTIAGLHIGILATTNSSGSLAQAHSIAQSLSGSGVQSTVIAETVQDGVDASYIAPHSSTFDGIIVTDGTGNLFNYDGSSATLYPPERPIRIVRSAFDFGKPVAVIGGTHALLSLDISVSSSLSRMLSFPH